MTSWRSAALTGWAAALPLFAGSCSRPGSTSLAPVLDGDAVARSVVLCKTTEAELRAQLGKPTRDGVLRRARILSWITRDNGVVSYLAVLLNARGIVVDMYWDIPTEVPWVPADQCA